MLENFSLALYPGEMAALVGANGSGKSTLLKLLAGLIRPSAGRICYFGREYPAKSAALSGVLSYLPQDDPLMEELSVRDNLSLYTGSSHPPVQLLEEFSLGELLEVRVKKLSGGMKRRLAIAACCAGERPVLLLDEPTASLDPEQKRRLGAWMLKCRDRGAAILIASHDETEIGLCGRRIQL